MPPATVKERQEGKRGTGGGAAVTLGKVAGLGTWWLWGHVCELREPQFPHRGHGAMIPTWELTPWGRGDTCNLLGRVWLDKGLSS